MNRIKWFEKKFNFDLNQNDMSKILLDLRKTPAKIDEIICNLSQEIMVKKPAGVWSIKQNIGHLIDLEELHSGRIDDFIAEREVLRPADLNNEKTELAAHNEKDIGELLKEFKKVREDFIERLSNLDQQVLSRCSIHPRLKQPMRPIDMAQFVLEHDEHHIQTISELIL